MSSSRGRSLLKTLPGLLVSAFFLWYTFKGISFSQIFGQPHGLSLVHPAWIFGVLAFTAASYTLRCVRWTRMLRSTGARFPVCARVLMTSLAANNILPFRIGDIMRVFTYSPDIGASPSVLLSTVILEKLLDIFILVLLFVRFMGPNVSHTRAYSPSRSSSSPPSASSPSCSAPAPSSSRCAPSSPASPANPSSPGSSTGSPSPSTASARSASPAPSSSCSRPPSSGSARA